MKGKKRRKGNSTESERSEAELERKPAAEGSNDTPERFELGNNRFVSVSEFRGRKYVDIREYYVDKKTAELKPSRKGIALKPEEWTSLTKQLADAIDKQL